MSLPGESHGQKSLVGYSARGHEDPDTAERLSTRLTRGSRALQGTRALHTGVHDGKLERWRAKGEQALLFPTVGLLRTFKCGNMEEKLLEGNQQYAMFLQLLVVFVPQETQHQRALSNLPEAGAGVSCAVP